MAERRFLLVDSEVLPDVFLKVLEAKQLLASGTVSNISLAARQAGISRSAFYKYKDYVFDAESGRETITVIATLLDKTGALQGLLSGISAAGASIVTITQSRPENGTAQVEETLGVPVRVVEAESGFDLVDAMLGMAAPPPDAVMRREETEYYQYNPGAK